MKNATKTPSMTATKKTTKAVAPIVNKPWSVNGRTGYHAKLRGFKEGDMVNIEVNGKKVKATFKTFKVSPTRYPEGKVVVIYKGKNLKRIASGVTKIAVTA
jgi:ribosomal protein L21E